MGIRVQDGPLLRELTSLGLGGRAMAQVVLGGERDLDGLPGMLDRLGGRPIVLGRGTNILATDEDMDLVLVRVPESRSPEIVSESGDRVRVRAWAGTPLPLLLAWLRDRGLSGLEGLSGIPGGVGGAVAMNAGSYGCELRRVLARVRLYTPCCGLFWAPREDLEVGYRHFTPRVADDYFIILALEADFKRSTPEEVGRAMDEAMDKKKHTQPLGAASAGCVFKNPPGEEPAGLLLDRVGVRGMRLGGMSFSEVHANFLVNLGGGTSAQAFELIATARERVRALKKIELELEVKVLS